MQLSCFSGFCPGRCGFTRVEHSSGVSGTVHRVAADFTSQGGTGRCQRETIDVKGKPSLVATALPPDVPRWLASRDQLLLALGLCPPSRTLFQCATEVGKKQPFSSTSPETNTSRRAQPKSVLGSYREASHRGTSGGRAVTNLAWCFIVVSWRIVTLSSTNESVAKPTVSSITIAAGQTSNTFTVRTFRVSSTRTPKITATANGISKEATLTVKP